MMVRPTRALVAFTVVLAIGIEGVCAVSPGWRGLQSMSAKVKKNLLRVKEKFRAMSYAAFQGYLRKKVIVLPSPSLSEELDKRNEAENGKNGECTEEPQSSVLLMILPGASLSGSEYIGLSKVMQQHAASRNVSLTIGIGFINYSKFDKWLCNNDYGVVLDIIQSAVATVHNSSVAVYDKIFIMGHSAGGLFAIDAAYPSKYDGLILYGALMNSQNLKQPVTKQRSVSSYPKPTLQMIGNRDGFLRYLLLAQELQSLEDDLHRRNSGHLKVIAETEGDEIIQRQHHQQIKRIETSLMLDKPVITLPELNHMHMSTGTVPEMTRATGRSDFTSTVATMDEAYNILGKTVVDFIHIHSVSAAKDSNTEQSRQNILGLVNATKSELDPFRQLLDSAYISRFLESVQEQMLHLERNNNSDEIPQIVITSRWHTCRDDFLYSKPTWIPQKQQLQIEVVEQAPLHISRVPQVSKTMALKGKSQQAIAESANSTTTAIRVQSTTPPPSLMTINYQTFQMVLTQIVTPEQKKRYLREGKQLRFGPDILVEKGAPTWVNTPISIQRKQEEESDVVYYLLRSPYITTRTDVPMPKFAGMWYVKPLTPSQAYEWIVFDAFKP